MTSSNGNIFRVTGPLWGESTVSDGFPSQRPVTRSFDVFFELSLHKWLSKQLRHRLFETPLRSFWRHCNILHTHLSGLHHYHWQSWKQTQKLILSWTHRQCATPVHISLYFFLSGYLSQIINVVATQIAGHFYSQRLAKPVHLIWELSCPQRSVSYTSIEIRRWICNYFCIITCGVITHACSTFDAISTKSALTWGHG